MSVFIFMSSSTLSTNSKKCRWQTLEISLLFFASNSFRAFCGKKERHHHDRVTSFGWTLADVFFSSISIEGVQKSCGCKKIVEILCMSRLRSARGGQIKMKNGHRLETTPTLVKWDGDTCRQCVITAYSVYTWITFRAFPNRLPGGLWNDTHSLRQYIQSSRLGRQRTSPARYGKLNNEIDAQIKYVSTWRSERYPRSSAVRKTVVKSAAGP